MNLNTRNIPFAKPSLNHEEENAVIKVLRSGWLTTGPFVKKFEEDFSEFTGAPFCLAVNSATSGLHLALEAAGVGPGDKVLTTTYTFTSTAEVIRYLGAELVFSDIDNDGNIDTDHCRQILQMHSDIKVIIPVHLGGKICRMDEVQKLAEEFKLLVIEDSAHAFPSETESGFAGCLGDFGVYSFYASKTITTGEGGMVVCKDKKVYERMKIMRLHGIDRDVWNRYTDVKSTWDYDIVAPGFKYNMSDISGAMGCVQLKKSMDFLYERKKIAEYYLKKLKNIRLFILPENSSGHAWHLFQVLLDSNISNGSRDTLAHELQDSGIGISIHFKPLHMMTYYRTRYGFNKNDFPKSRLRYENIISLPIYPGLSKSDQDYITDKIILLEKKWLKT